MTNAHVRASLMRAREIYCYAAYPTSFHVYLDVIGTLPTPREANEFLQSRDPDKRSALIGRLLARDQFADYWAMKWSDLLRIKAEFPVNLWPNAAQAYHRWVRASIAENKPYDKFARELLTSSGSNFRVGPVNFYRAIQNRTPEGITRAVALTFAWPRRSTRASSAACRRSPPNAWNIVRQERWCWPKRAPPDRNVT
jgi:hypothetical protein